MKLGFIGAGRMATALAKGCVQAGLAPADGILASDPFEAARIKFQHELPAASLHADNGPVLAGADLIVLAVKPQVMPQALADICDSVEPRHLLISIAAGVTIARMSQSLPSGARVIRVMPNTPCLIGQGVSCFSRGETASAEDAGVVEKLLVSVGKAYEVEEAQLDAVTGLSGSGPAFIYSVVEALAEGGVAMGLAPDMALDLAAQTTLGAAGMVLATGLSPAELRSQVTSPNGTTLAGLEALAQGGGAAALRAAVEAAARRSVELGKA